MLWFAWFEQRETQPTQTDYYLMQVAAEIRRILVGLARGDASNVRLEDFRLRFSKPSPVRESPDEVKARWCKFVGLKLNDTN